MAAELWRNRLLLTLLIGVIVVQPVASAHVAGKALVVLAFTMILTGGVRASGAGVWVTAVCAGLALLIAVLNAIVLFTGSDGAGPALIGVAVVFGAFTVSRTMIALFGSEESDAEALAGAVFGYFLLAVVWALLYRAIDVLSPGAFNLAPGRDAFSELVYFSLVTISTLGYGDIAPLTPFARVSAGMEAAVGPLYLSILIARIVGVFERRRR